MILIEESFGGIGIQQDETGKKKYLYGIFMEAGVKNRNGRIYDLAEMKTECARINADAANGIFTLGELDHPSTLEVKYENVCHKIVSLELKGNQVYGKSEILTKHPKGAILAAIIEHDVKPGVSSRASGSWNQTTGKVSNLKLVTVDAVAVPSCRSAYPETLEEQLLMYSRGDVVTELSEAVINDPAAQKYFMKEIHRFLDSLH